MKGRAFIDRLRRMAETARLTGDIAISEEYAIEADAVEEADVSYRSFIQCASLCVSEGMDRAWWDTRHMNCAYQSSHDSLPVPMPDEDAEQMARALSYLDRRGLIERKSGEPHLIRFVEET